MGTFLSFSIISLILGASFQPISHSSFSYPCSGPCSLLAQPIPVAVVTVATVALLTQESFVLGDHRLVYEEPFMKSKESLKQRQEDKRADITNKLGPSHEDRQKKKIP